MSDHAVSRAIRNAQPSSDTTTRLTGSPLRELAVKVPQITLWFWVIKILCTTVGETAADYLNTSLHLGLTGTSVVTAVMLAGALALQVTAKKYIPWRYWLTVTLVSVFGTLVTDNLTDNLKVPLIRSTIVFSVLLGLVYVLWFRVEKSLSIHSVRTRRREAFYWLAVFVTFALGTATGDLMAERLGFGYLPTGLIVAGLIVAAALLKRVGMSSILSFWMIYILTRPLGASIGDFMAQPRSAGGIGLGTTVTSVVFLASIAAVVAFLTISKTDVISGAASAHEDDIERGGLWQTAVVLVLVVAASVVGYNARKNVLTDGVSTTAVGAARLGDLSKFSSIASEALALVDANNQAGAHGKADDLEREWDLAQAKLEARDKAQWTVIDGKVDAVLTALRAKSPVAATETTALNELLAGLK